VSDPDRAMAHRQLPPRTGAPLHVTTGVHTLNLQRSSSRAFHHMPVPINGLGEERPRRAGIAHGSALPALAIRGGAHAKMVVTTFTASRRKRRSLISVTPLLQAGPSERMADCACGLAR
jgi:hypothetical protein